MLLTSAVLLMTACGDSNGGGTELRVVHGSPDAPSVDVLVDNQVVLSNVPFKVASEYLDIDEGARNVKVNAAGTTTTVIDVTPTLQEHTAYTVIATNYLASIEPLLLVDDRVPAAQGKAKVRVVHGAPGAPAVDVYVTAPGASLDGVTPVLANVPYKAASDYLTVDAGEYQVRVTVAGTQTVAIDTGTVELVSRGVYSAIAVDAVGGGAPFGALLLKDR
jgi:hypothetical protein